MKKQTKKYVEPVAVEVADYVKPSKREKKAQYPVEAVLATLPLPKPTDYEICMLANVCQKMDLKFDYCGIEISLTENSWNYSEINLTWKDYAVEDKLFQQAWDIARNPLHGVPRPFRHEDVPMNFDEYNEKDYTHKEVYRAIRYSHEWPDWLYKYEKVKKTYDKLALKSPMIGLKWAEAKMQKAAPWCNHKELTARVIAALNSMDFLPYAGIVSYTEKYGSDPSFIYAVGHEKGHPIVWRQERSWSSEGEAVLDHVTVELHSKGFTVSLDTGKKYPHRYSIKTGEECAEMLLELPFRIQKIWLDSLDRKFAGSYTVNTLTGLAAIRNKETFDTEIFVVSGDPGPGHYNFEKTLVPTDKTFIGMYTTAINNLKGGK